MTTPTPKPRLYPPSGRQLVVQMVQGTQPAACVVGFRDGGTHSQSMGQEALGAFWAAFRVLMSTTVTCTGALWRDASQADGVVFNLAAPTSPTGSVAGAVSVAASSTLISWRTLRGGRSGKGRTFLPGLVTGAVDADGRSYPTATRTQVQTAINAYLASANFSPALIQPAVLSFTKGEANAIVSGVPGTVVGLQRRRMRA